MAWLGLLCILLVLASIMSKRFTPMVALILIPVLTVLALGQIGQLGEYIAQGVAKVAPVAVMFIFAILFFGILHDAKMFDPIVAKIISLVGHDPKKIFPGTVLLTALVHLDGSGASTFLIAIPALKPLYEKLQLDLRMLACLVAMTAGVCNMLPWGGPAIRAASALDIDVLDVYLPMLWVQLSGLLFVLLFAYVMGRKHINTITQIDHHEVISLPHKGRFIINLVTTVLVVVSMVVGWIPPMGAFMIGTIVVLLINFPLVSEQNTIVNKHAKTALLMASILFAAGVFNGVLKGTGMLQAMAQSGSQILPDVLSSHLPVVVGVLSMPLSLLFDPDSFYFGILPVLAGVAEQAGVAGIEVAQAALLGQMTTGFAVSPLTPATFLLVGLCGIELADHQRYTLPKLLLTSWVMVVVSLFVGLLSL